MRHQPSQAPSLAVRVAAPSPAAQVGLLLLGICSLMLLRLVL